MLFTEKLFRIFTTAFTNGSIMKMNPLYQFQHGLKLQIISILLLCCVKYFKADCPTLCECKWKSGKESVNCLNANLSIIPLQLDEGTQVLDMTGNNIMKLSHDELSAAGLVNLQKLYISKCRIRSLERFAFRNLTNLIELDLSYNALSIIPSHTFDSIPELRELRISGNPIQKILNQAFIHVPQIVRLDLSNCRIHQIEPRAFQGLEKTLEWLDLGTNRLRDVNSTSITSLFGLHGIDLGNNLWNCTCKLRPLREWMLKNNIPSNVSPKCKTPLRLEDKFWDKLDLEEFACAPTIEPYPIMADQVAGENITLSCRIEGEPRPSTHWSIKNRILSPTKVQITDQNLTIYSLDIQDAGSYTCSAENKAGKAEATILLTIRPVTSQNFPISIHVIITVFLVISLVCLSIYVFVIKKQSKELRSNLSGLNLSNLSHTEPYESIEMKYKINNNCALLTNGLMSNGGMVKQKMGEYVGVPTIDDDEEFVEEERKLGVLERRCDAFERGLSNEDVSVYETDLHIPRRSSYIERQNRDDWMRIPNSPCGTSKNLTHNLNLQSQQTNSLLVPHLLHKKVLNPSGNTIYTTAPTIDEDYIPDLLTNSHANSYDNGNYSSRPSECSINHQYHQNNVPNYNSTYYENTISASIEPAGLDNIEEETCFLEDQESNKTNYFSDPNTLNYHASQLESYLELYRLLQMNLNQS